MIKITKKIVEEIFKQAKAEAPIEACGYLAGKSNEVLKHYPMKNIDQSKEHFSFDVADQFAVVKEAREDGLVMIGNYHSHPESPARPSKEDIKLAYDPNIIYLIASLYDMGVKAFKIVKGQVTEEELTIGE